MAFRTSLVLGKGRLAFTNWFMQAGSASRCPPAGILLPGNTRAYSAEGAKPSKAASLTTDEGAEDATVKQTVISTRQFIQRLAERLDTNPRMARAVLHATQGLLAEAMSKSEAVMWQNFGKFSSKERIFPVPTNLFRKDTEGAPAAPAQTVTKVRPRFQAGANLVKFLNDPSGSPFIPPLDEDVICAFAERADAARFRGKQQPAEEESPKVDEEESVPVTPKRRVKKKVDAE